MGYKLIKVSSNNSEQVSRFIETGLNDCIDALQKGGVVVFPTETLYGLGVDIKNEEAIDRLIDLKGRPSNMPIAVAVSELHQASELVEISEFALKIIENCLPGPITILLPVKDVVNRKLMAGSHLLGLRFPDQPVTIELLKRFGPITATSANLHGAPAPTTIEPVVNQFGDKVNVYLDSGPCKIGQPSTVIDPSERTIKIIRDGACSRDEIMDCVRGN